MQEQNSSQIRPKLYQFKNALHFGIIAPFKNKVENKHQRFNAKPNHLSSRDSQFTRSVSNFQGLLPKSYQNAKQLIEKMGLSIDDEGNVLLANQKNDKIHGKYFLFKPNIIGQSRMENEYEGICQYGSMENGHLQGDNYLFHRKGVIVKGSFDKDAINEQCYLYQSYNLSLNDTEQNTDNRVQCQVINIPITNIRNQSEERKLVISRFEQIYKQKEGKKSPHKAKRQMPNSIVFLKEMINQCSASGSKDQRLASLSHIALNEQELFIGFILPKKQEGDKEKKSKQDLKAFNGFGMIIRSGWPYKYGTFELGRLQGLGRRYLNEMKFEDGFFFNDELLQGFVSDYQNKTIYFGHSSIMEKKECQKKEFIVSRTMDLSQHYTISQYRKKYHLKSLNYTNNYFNQPSLVNHSPWPYYVVTVLEQKSKMGGAIKSFSPIRGISPFSKKVDTGQGFYQGGSTEKREYSVIQRGIKSERQLRSLNIKKGIKNYLQKEAKQSEEQHFDENIKEYKRIQTAKEIKNFKNDKFLPPKQESTKRILKSPSPHYFHTPQPVDILPEKSAESKRITSRNLQDLMRDYEQYLHEKQLLKTRRKQAKEKAKQQKMPATSGRRMTSTSSEMVRCNRDHLLSKPSKSNISLDQIYKLYLKY